MGKLPFASPTSALFAPKAAFRRARFGLRGAHKYVAIPDAP